MQQETNSGSIGRRSERRQGRHDARRATNPSSIERTKQQSGSLSWTPSVKARTVSVSTLAVEESVVTAHGAVISRSSSSTAEIDDVSDTLIALESLKSGLIAIRDEHDIAERRKREMDSRDANNSTRARKTWIFPLTPSSISSSRAGSLYTADQTLSDSDDPRAGVIPQPTDETIVTSPPHVPSSTSNAASSSTLLLVPASLDTQANSAFLPSDAATSISNPPHSLDSLSDSQIPSASLEPPPIQPTSEILPIPKPQRPSPHVLVSESIDSHVPTLSSLGLPHPSSDSNTSRTETSPPTATIPSNSTISNQQSDISKIATTVSLPSLRSGYGWDTLRPRLGLPLLGTRKVPLETIVGADSHPEKPSADMEIVGKESEHDALLSSSSLTVLMALTSVSGESIVPIMTLDDAETSTEAEDTTVETDVESGHAIIAPASDLTSSSTPSLVPSSTPGIGDAERFAGKDGTEKEKEATHITPASSTSWFSFFSTPAPTTANINILSQTEEETASSPETSRISSADGQESVGAQESGYKNSEDEVEGPTPTQSPVALEATSPPSPAIARAESASLPPATSWFSFFIGSGGAQTPANPSAQRQSSDGLPSEPLASAFLSSPGASDVSTVMSDSEGEQGRAAEGALDVSTLKAQPQEQIYPSESSWLAYVWPWKSTVSLADTGMAEIQSQDNNDRNKSQIREDDAQVDNSPKLDGDDEARNRAMVRSPAVSSLNQVLNDTSPTSNHSASDLESPLLNVPGARSGWMSFFVSGAGSLGPAKGAKMIEASKDENDVEEVMVLDLNEMDAAVADGTAEKSKDGKDLRQDPNPSAPINIEENTRNMKAEESIVSSQGPPLASSPSSQLSTSAPQSSISPTKREPLKANPQPPLTDSASLKRAVAENGKKSTKPPPSPTKNGSASGSRSSSPAPSTASDRRKEKDRKLNLILPTFNDTFKSKPRCDIPEQLMSPSSSSGSASGSGFMKKVTGYLLGSDFSPSPSGDGTANSPTRKGKQPQHVVGDGLPRLWSVLEQDRKSERHGKKGSRRRSGKSIGITAGAGMDTLRGCKRVVIIGIHGFFPGAFARSVLGAPTGTSSKFANMMSTAVQTFVEEHRIALEKITVIPLEGEGTISQRVDKLYQNLLANETWISDVHDADVIFIATHSQGSIVSTELLDLLINQGHISTSQGGSHPIPVAVSTPGANDMVSPIPKTKKYQRVCCLAMCGIHLGPLAYLSSSAFMGPYLQIFESVAATELFEFQDTKSEVSKAYVKALSNVLDHGVKFVYIASLNDQVVPIYSGIFTAASHPSILRALYIDGDAYSSSDFLSNLLVLLLKIRNAGEDDIGLMTHLSEATAGSLSGVGHSTAYEDLETYTLAVRYLFEASGNIGPNPPLRVEPFLAKAARNDYEIPWALREVIAHDSGLFVEEWHTLSAAFEHWQPRTSTLREMKRKLQPIQRLRKSKL